MEHRGREEEERLKEEKEMQVNERVCHRGTGQERQRPDASLLNKIYTPSSPEGTGTKSPVYFVLYCVHKILSCMNKIHILCT